MANPLYVTLSPNIEVKVCKFFHLPKNAKISRHQCLLLHEVVKFCRAKSLTKHVQRDYIGTILVHFKKHINLLECLLVLFQMFLSRHSQEPEFLPLTDQLTELWGVGVEVLQGYWYSRLQLKSAPPLWMDKHGILESARATNFCFTHQWHYYNNDFYFALFSYGGLLVRGRLLGETCCLEMLLCLQDFVACSTSGNFLFISSMNTCGEE